MKGIDIFCTSQAATSIISSSMEHEHPPSSSSSTVLLGGGRAIDRHNPIIRDSSRIPKKSAFAPCNTPQSPISPKPHQKKRSTSSHKLPLKENYSEIKKCNSSINIHEPDSIVVVVDEKKKKDSETIVKAVRKSWSCTRPGGFISPPGSTRYLLGDDDNKVLVNDVSDLKLFDEENDEKIVVNQAVKTDALLDVNEDQLEKMSSACVSPAQPQVVVLRVSLHCRGCERKMRKHISRMEGVTSFNIDFLAKKVTVEGNVTPLGVLSSISKVKNAQLWSPTISSTTPASVKQGPIKNETKRAETDAKVGDKEEVFLSMAPQIKLV